MCKDGFSKGTVQLYCVYVVVLGDLKSKGQVRKNYIRTVWYCTYLYLCKMWWWWHLVPPPPAWSAATWCCCRRCWSCCCGLPPSAAAPAPATVLVRWGLRASPTAATSTSWGGWASPTSQTGMTKKVKRDVLLTQHRQTLLLCVLKFAFLKEFREFDAIHLNF